jgi:hypothetical protein
MRNGSTPISLEAARQPQQQILSGKVKGCRFLGTQLNTFNQLAD